MDSVEVQAGALYCDKDAAPAVRGAMREVLDQNEKREDHYIDSCCSEDGDVDQDMDCSYTQVLLPESMDDVTNAVEVEELPMSSVTIHSSVKEHVSPAKTLVEMGTSSITEAAGSLDEERTSLLKDDASTLEKSSSLTCIQLPVKVQAPSLSVQSLSAKSLQSVVTQSPPIAGRSDQEEDGIEVTSVEVSEEVRADGAEGKFTKVFPAVAKLVEMDGWQIAQGQNTLFCAMPGVHFFNFKPNINVFDSKTKACWKFIQVAGEKEVDMEDKELWEMLWPIAEKEFGWFTMMCGAETWFVKPNTEFENFRPNETIFQTKKRAVLKCLALEVGEIELGDSSEGHQVVAFAPREAQPKPSFAPKKVKTSLFKTPSPGIKSLKQTVSSSDLSTTFVTPAKHVSPGSATACAKRKLSSSVSNVSSKASTSKKKAKMGGSVSAKKVTTKRKAKSPSYTALDTGKRDEFNFTPPEFRCTFGIVYAKLQDEGWHHRSGTFEYDYFSPTYTDATKKVKVNFFQSQADLEEFLKVSGTWKRIENELRDEHEKAVDEEREKALDRHHQRLEQQAARKRNLALYGALPAVAKAKKSSKKGSSKKVSAPLVSRSLYQTEVEAARAIEAEELKLARMPRLKFGTVVQKLVKRGWFYRPGRFEYDYFTPGANPKTAVAGEDRFESASALEVYLKTTGIWEKIAEEVALEEYTQLDMKSRERPPKHSKLESPPPPSVQSPKKVLGEDGAQKEDVKAITNDIWANSHEFDFNE
uniref:Uncharacterized protein n=1 Tax=Hyaloperonospora arabidopsidis (strain Emoy2) TaxID=559515 RepID=M4BC42_HYAAE